jgi:dephospho-CoA kinase
MMYVIGLTGNIATGKSTVLEMLRALGAEIIDADALAHEVMSPRSPQWEAIVQAFGPRILTPGGEIDRVALGEIVFQDREELQQLEGIVHPEVARRIRQAIAVCDCPVVVIEAIKLLESGLGRRCDALWVVTASSEQQLERLMRERDLSEAAARQRIEIQPPQEEKVALADVVIDNSGSLNETRRQVESHWRQIVGSVIEDSGASGCCDREAKPHCGDNPCGKNRPSPE